MLGLFQNKVRLALEYKEAGSGIWRQNERFYQNLFDEAPSAFFSIGADGRIRMANRRALQLLGYQSDEIIARWFLDLYAVSPAGKVKAWEVFRKFRAGLEIPGQELEMRRADGTSVWVRLVVQPIRDAAGRVVASCSMVQEIARPKWLGPCQARHHDLPHHDKSAAQRLIALPDDSKATETHLERVLIKWAGCAYVLNVNEIDWFGAAGNYIQLHVGAKSYLLRRTMNDLEAKLDPRQFLRIHRSAIVNVERIKELQTRACGDYHVILRDGMQLTLSRSYRKKVQDFLGNPL